MNVPGANRYAPGQWNFYCDFCGAKRKSSDGVRSWQGNYVCQEHREVRNPQDFIKGVKDNQTVPWSRPRTIDTFVLTCTWEGQSAVPLLAMPGCMIPGRPFLATRDPAYAFCTPQSAQSRADLGAADCATVGRL